LHCIALHSIPFSFKLYYIGQKQSEREDQVSDADRVREYAKERYVLPARQQKQKRFSIRVGDVVRDLRMNRAVPAVCSALKTSEFRQSNDLRLVDTSGPKSGQSTTVIYTYEFVGTKQSSQQTEDSWSRLRGALKDVFTELGGGETYLRAERSDFYPKEKE
jgi:hypothetical protein